MNLAFVLGCSAYQDPIPSLKYAARDAERFAAALRETCGLARDEILLLSDADGGERPGFTNVLRALSRGRRSVAEGLRVETLFFFFSGHGYHSEVTGEDYLLVGDSVADDLEHTALSVPDVVRRLAEWQPRHLVLFLDACRETVKQGKSLPGDALNAPNVNALLPPGHVTFCSCSAGERSYESDAVSAGLFTAALCEALSDVGRCRTLYELNAYLRRRVPELSTSAGKPRQTPAARLEPAEVLSLEVVSARKRNLWRTRVPIGSEQRARRVPRGAAPPGTDRAVGNVGIDFGTCNSLIGLLLPPDGVQVIPDPWGRGLVPSVVNFGPDLDYTVGWEALDADRIRPEGTIRHVKRALGTSAQFQVYDRSLTPEFVTSLILRSLKKNAEEFLGAPLRGVVAGYPASFSIAQHNALAAAFEMAGISVLRYVGEPSAAGLLLPRHPDDENSLAYHTGLVVDLGGGTLDVSVVEASDGAWEIKGTAGNGRLGGIDYDEVLADYLSERVRSMAGDQLSLPGHIAAEIRREAERAKHALTHTAECLVILRDVEFTLGDSRDVPILVDRRTFDALSAHLTAEVVRTVRRAIREAEEFRLPDGQITRNELSDIDFILLAGQGTKVPTLLDAVRRVTDAPVLAKHQDDAVLRGLARQAGVLSGAVKDALLLDSFYRAIGVRLRTRANDDPARRLALESDDRLNDTIVPLIDRGRNIPTKASTIVFAPGGGDPVRRLRVVELDRNWDDAVVAPLGVVEIDTSGEDARLQLTLDIDANAIINLEINDLTHNRRRVIRLNSRDRSGGELITEQRLTGSLDDTVAASTP